MLKALLPSILWALVILFLSAMPSINLPETLWDLLAPDKWAHVLVYGILTFLLLQNLSTQISDDEKKVVVTALIISILYGILMEGMQYTFFPYRYFEYLDIIANIIGCFTGMAFYHFSKSKRHD